MGSYRYQLLISTRETGESLGKCGLVSTMLYYSVYMGISVIKPAHRHGITSRNRMTKICPRGRDPTKRHVKLNGGIRFGVIQVRASTMYIPRLINCYRWDLQVYEFFWQGLGRWLHLTLSLPDSNGK